ncbi:unnamed protein product [Moneuplotes crassus]|uniref:Uncharacterized protein n=1 Tax=Euplotes crassus TaxID=5936 RepID=A0AAD1UA68_EUPCR|nr:unnamed protein product [Moneuplotes crassus]
MLNIQTESGQSPQEAIRMREGRLSLLWRSNSLDGIDRHYKGKQSPNFDGGARMPLDRLFTRTHKKNRMPRSKIFSCMNYLRVKSAKNEENVAPKPAFTKEFTELLKQDHVSALKTLDLSFHCYDSYEYDSIEEDPIREEVNPECNHHNQHARLHWSQERPSKVVQVKRRKRVRLPPISKPLHDLPSQSVSQKARQDLKGPAPKSKNSFLKQTIKTRLCQNSICFRSKLLLKSADLY